MPATDPLHRILEVLAEKRARLTATELAEEVGCGRPMARTIMRLLRTSGQVSWTTELRQVPGRYPFHHAEQEPMRKIRVYWIEPKGSDS